MAGSVLRVFSFGMVEVILHPVRHGAVASITGRRAELARLLRVQGGDWLS